MKITKGSYIGVDCDTKRAEHKDRGTYGASKLNEYTLSQEELDEVIQKYGPPKKKANAYATRFAKSEPKEKKRCSVEGCDNPSRTLGWCVKHYGRYKLYGDPTFLKREAK